MRCFFNYVPFPWASLSLLSIFWPALPRLSSAEPPSDFFPDMPRFLHSCAAFLPGFCSISAPPDDLPFGVIFFLPSYIELGHYMFQLPFTSPDKLRFSFRTELNWFSCSMRPPNVAAFVIPPATPRSLYAVVSGIGPCPKIFRFGMRPLLFRTGKRF